MAGAKPLCHFGKGRVVGRKRDFPVINQCRRRRGADGADSKPRYSPKKGRAVSNVIYQK